MECNTNIPVQPFDHEKFPLAEYNGEFSVASDISQDLVKLQITITVKVFETKEQILRIVEQYLFRINDLKKLGEKIGDKLGLPIGVYRLLFNVALGTLRGTIKEKLKDFPTKFENFPLVTPQAIDEIISNNLDPEVVSEKEA